MPKVHVVYSPAIGATIAVRATEPASSAADCCDTTAASSTAIGDRPTTITAIAAAAAAADAAAAAAARTKTPERAPPPKPPPQVLSGSSSEAVSTLIRGVMTKRMPAIEQPSVTDAAAAAPSAHGRVPEQQTPPERPTSSEAASAKRPRGQAPPLAPAPADKRPRTTTLLNFFKPKEVVDVKAAETRSIAETSAAHGGANDSAHDGTRDSSDRGGGSGGNGARASGGAIGAGGASGAGGANGAGGSSGLSSSSAIPSVVTGSNSRLATRPNGKQPMAPLRIDPNPDIRPADMSPYFFKKMREDAEKLELQVAQEKERRQAEQRPLLQATPAAAAAPLASGHWRQKTLEDAAKYGDTHALLSGVKAYDWCEATTSKKRPDKVARLLGAIRTKVLLLHYPRETEHGGYLTPEGHGTDHTTQMLERAMRGQTRSSTFTPTRLRKGQLTSTRSTSHTSS